jgi:hypothetical protein
LILRWIKDDDEQYCAYSGDRTYMVRLFNVGAYDGDPTLTMYDDRYRSTCWSLTTLMDIAIRKPVRLFEDRSSAMVAAQLAEDNASEHECRLPDMDDPPGRHRRVEHGERPVTITGRDGNTYTYWSRRYPPSDRGAERPVAGR